MSGIYIHIPFCKQKCSYCDFHFSTDLSYKDKMVEAICQELQVKSDDWSATDVSTLYLGGGTPSLLTAQQLRDIKMTIDGSYNLLADAEITLEANPDDIDSDKLSSWVDQGVNRLSIGIQSFDDRDLRQMNRAHDASMAENCVKVSRAAGINNISVDMIYGLPDRSLVEFKENANKFLELEVDHISAYNLTIEEGTLFHQMVRKGKLSLPDPEVVGEQFLFLKAALGQAGFEQYEVSNFAQEGMISKHNSSYWKTHNYIGVGPSAHSFDGKRRQWNIANNHLYMKAISAKELFAEREELTEDERFNEYVMTRSRTKWGLDLEYIRSEFNIDLLQEADSILDRYAGKYEIKESILKLNDQGLLLADRFASDLFKVD